MDDQTGTKTETGKLTLRVALLQLASERSE